MSSDFATAGGFDAGRREEAAQVHEVQSDGRFAEFGLEERSRHEVHADSGSCEADSMSEYDGGSALRSDTGARIVGGDSATSEDGIVAFSRLNPRRKFELTD